MAAKTGIYIKFLPDDIDAPASHKDQTVLDVAIRAGIDLNHTCEGMGTCGTCVVKVLKGAEALPPREEVEMEIATDRGYQEAERLACQIPPVDGLVLYRGSNV